MPFGEQALPVGSEDEAEPEDDDPVAGLGEGLNRSPTPELVMSNIALTRRAS
jgi:hypothetical protein